MALPQTPLGSLQRFPTPDSLAGFKGPTSKGGREKGRGERGGEESGGRRRERGRGGLSGNVAEEAFCLKSAPIRYVVVLLEMNV